MYGSFIRVYLIRLPIHIDTHTHIYHLSKFARLYRLHKMSGVARKKTETMKREEQLNVSKRGTTKKRISTLPECV